MNKNKQKPEPTIIMWFGRKYRALPDKPYKWVCHWSPFPQYEPNEFECPNCGGKTNEWPEQWSNCPFCGEPIEMPDDKPHSDKDAMEQKAHDEILKRLNDK